MTRKKNSSKTSKGHVSEVKAKSGHTKKSAVNVQQQPIQHHWKDDVIQHYKAECRTAWSCFLAASLDRYLFFLKIDNMCEDIPAYKALGNIKAQSEFSEKEKVYLAGEISREMEKNRVLLEKRQNTAVERYVKTLNDFIAGCPIESLPSIDPNVGCDYFKNLVRKAVVPPSSPPAVSEEDRLNLSFTSSIASEESGLGTTRNALDELPDSDLHRGDVDEVDDLDKMEGWMKVPQQLKREEGLKMSSTSPQIDPRLPTAKSKDLLVKAGAVQRSLSLQGSENDEEGCEAKSDSVPVKSVTVEVSLTEAKSKTSKVSADEMMQTENFATAEEEKSDGVHMEVETSSGLENTKKPLATSKEKKSMVTEPERTCSSTEEKVKLPSLPEEKVKPPPLPEEKLKHSSLAEKKVKPPSLAEEKMKRPPLAGNKLKCSITAEEEVQPTLSAQQKVRNSTTPEANVELPKQISSPYVAFNCEEVKNTEGDGELEKEVSGMIGSSLQTDLASSTSEMVDLPMALGAAEQMLSSCQKRRKGKKKHLAAVKVEPATVEMEGLPNGMKSGTPKEQAGETDEVRQPEGLVVAEKEKLSKPQLKVDSPIDNERLSLSASPGKEKVKSSLAKKKVTPSSLAKEKVKPLPAEEKVNSSSPGAETVKPSPAEEKPKAPSPAKEKVGSSSPSKKKAKPSSPSEEKAKPSSSAKEKAKPSSSAKEKVKPSSSAKEKAKPSSSAKEKAKPSSPAKEKVKPSSPTKEKVNPSPAKNNLKCSSSDVDKDGSLSGDLLSTGSVDVEHDVNEQIEDDMLFARELAKRQRVQDSRPKLKDEPTKTKNQSKSVKSKAITPAPVARGDNSHVVDENENLTNTARSRGSTEKSFDLSSSPCRRESVMPLNGGGHFIDCTVLDRPRPGQWGEDDWSTSSDGWEQIGFEDWSASNRFCKDQPSQYEEIERKSTTEWPALEKSYPLKPVTTKSQAAPGHSEPCDYQFCLARRQFYLHKTTICNQWKAGLCTYNAKDCKFAHGVKDKKRLPKHEMCERHKRGICRWKPSECVYAHTLAEYRPWKKETAERNVIVSSRYSSPADGDSTDSETATCAICFEAFTPQMGKCRLDCGHDEFHRKCMEHWLERDRSCPICREDIQTADSFVIPRKARQRQHARPCH